MKWNFGATIGLFIGLIISVFYLLEPLMNPTRPFQDSSLAFLGIFIFPLLIVGTIITITFSYIYPIGSPTTDCHYAYGCVTYFAVYFSLIIIFVGTLVMYSFIGYFVYRLLEKKEIIK